MLVSCDANQTAAEQMQLVAQGQYQERFDRAVESLGSNSIAVRTGAVLALDQLVADAAEFRAPTEELLARFVRDQAPLSACERPRWIPSDVQAALTTIGRYHIGPSKSSTKYTLDLRSTCLAGADLSGGTFTRADFAGADLSSTVLSGTDFTAAYMLRVRLTDAHLMRATFRCAVLGIPDFTDAWLIDVDMSRAEIIAPNFADALFVGVNFHSANVRGATLTSDQREEALGWNSRSEGCFPPDDYGPALAP